MSTLSTPMGQPTTRVNVRYVTVCGVTYLREEDIIALLDGEGVGAEREVIERILEGLRKAASARPDGSSPTP